MINKAIVTIEMLDEETGELTTKEFDIADLVAAAAAKKPAAKKKSSSSSKIEEEESPIIRLDENKYTLTSGAIAALGAIPGETRLVIRFQKIGSFTIPVMGISETFGIKSGNKLTLGGSVSCRGKANEELSEYGTEFILVAHPSVEGMFIMTQDGNLPEGDYSVKQKATKKKEEIPTPKFAQPEDVDELDAMLNDIDEEDDDFSL